LRNKSHESIAGKDRQTTRPRPHKNVDPSAEGAAISPARSLAFEILLRVAESDAHSDDLLHLPRTAQLSQEDRNLATALVMGVLRWQIALDAQVAKLLARPGQMLAEPVAIALRLGAFQLQHMDRIPAHAAINESVELCRAAGQVHAAGMVNAVLRKIAAESNPSTTRTPDAAWRRTPIFESPVALAQRLGHPAWLVERWIAEYGRDAALAICEYDQREPGAGPLFAETAAANLGGNAPLPVAPVQIDDGSRLVAELAAAALPDTTGRAARVWDCCAAPGGKTLVVAERLATAKILATDASPKRLARMRERFAVSPSADRIECEVMDAARPGLPSELTDGLAADAGFHLILCDVPCSGTGTLARNPEIRHRLRPEDLARQTARQRAILGGALARLAPGGQLLYSTCSLEPEENERLVEAVLKERPEMAAVPLGPVLERLATGGVLSREVAASLGRTAIRAGCLRTLPGVHPCDGFFAALLEWRSDAQTSS
jgi:16S rRNA (cytosine967-C5)-methyltransferase